ncbi:MAG: InlB B-repeat-containing protein [Bacteroidaceae bacterium]|nr:InlB B-repeat-containing protein [Bacteroidaceae bacterium]
MKILHKSLNLWLTSLLLLAGSGAYAQESTDTDLAQSLLTNSSFEEDYPLEEATGTVSDMGYVTAWDSNEDDPTATTYHVGGVFEVGGPATTYLAHNNAQAPSTNAEGTTGGQVLGFLCGYGSEVYYQQQITLSPGNYRLEIPIYNAAGTAAISKNQIGFIADDGHEYFQSTKEYAVGSWTYEEVTFTITQTTSGHIRLGYTSNAGTTSLQNQPHLFADYVRIYAESRYIPAPTFTQKDNFITISCTDTTTVIRYTFDGSEPSVENGDVFVNPFSVTDGTLIKAIAVSGVDVSEVSEFTYHYRQWDPPTLTLDGSSTADYVSGNSYYLFNVYSGQFLTAGNNYGTQMSITKDGFTDTDNPPLLIQISDSTLATPTALFEGQVLRVNGTYSVTYGSGSSSQVSNTYLFREGEIGYVDWVSQEQTLWTLTRVGEYYRLQSHSGYDADYSSQYVGWNGMYQNTALSMNLTGSSSYIDWALIESENTSSSSVALYDAQKELYDLLLIADSVGVSTDDAGAVYQNSASTVSELNAASAELQMYINLNNYSDDWSTASVDNPLDITGVFITNPDFDVSSEGWTLADGASYQSSTTVYTNTGSTLTRLGSATDESGAPASLNYFVEANHMSDMSVKQRLPMLPPGLYQLRVNAVATNNGKGVSGVEMYANYASRVANVTASALRNLTTAQEPENFNVYFFQERNFAPEIGVRASATDASWIAADRFRLFYLGTENPDFRYNVTFWGQDSLSVVSTAALNEGDAITVPDAPEVEGYTFVEWDSDIPSTMPPYDLDIRGIYTVNQYRLTFLLEGDTIDSKIYDYGTVYSVPEVTVPAGHTFSGWIGLPTTETMPAKDVVVNASFIKGAYTVNYYVDGELYKVVGYESGDSIAVEPDPIREGYTFSGWSSVPQIIVDENVNVNGTFTINYYKLVFVVRGEVVKEDSVAYATQIVAPSVTPGLTDYLAGWEPELPATMPAQDLTLNAVFKTLDPTPEAEGVFTTAGNLETLIADSIAAGSVSNGELTVRGQINKEDIDYLRSLPLTQIDLSNCDISTVVDGDTIVNIITTEMFSGLPKLEELSLPSTVTAVAGGAFSGNSSLLVLIWNSSAPVSAEAFDDAQSYGNLLVFAPENAEVTFEGNVIRGNIAQKITLADGAPFRNPRAFTAENISFTKSFAKATNPGEAGGWETIVLPFDVKRIERAEDHTQLMPFGGEAGPYLYFWLAEMDPTVGFVSADSILANVPFIISMPNSESYTPTFNIYGDITFSAAQASVHPTTEAQGIEGAVASFVPAYEGQEAAQDVFVLNEDTYNTFLPGAIFVRSSRNANPFEAYLSSEGHDVKGQFISIAEANAIMSVTQDRLINGLLNSGNSQVTDISGRRVSGSQMSNGKLPKGVYIISGNKVVVK